jgi:CTP:molybdopterin cytidylyltransferase MocA
MARPVSDFDIGCVILAAGAGTRFGGPKAAAILPSGMRFIDAVARAAHDAGAAPIIAVMHPRVSPPPGVRVVVNPDPASEQITSLRLGLAQLLNTAVRGACIWPVDHPHVRSETVFALLAEARRNAALIARPSYEGKHGHPVYFSRQLWRDLVTETSVGARSVVHRYASEVLDVVVADAGVIRNVDHPGD